MATEPSVVLEISHAALALALDGAPALAARFFRIVCQARAPAPVAQMGKCFQSHASAAVGPAPRPWSRPSAVLWGGE